MDISFIQALESRLLKPLPGIDAQALLAPTFNKKYLELHDDHRVACVLLLLFPKDSEWHVCYIERSSKNPEDRHAGQISFPGGKYEDSDCSFEYCALRETYEEIGISPDKIGIIGQLSELYVYVSKFRVFPFVGFMESADQFTLQESEVTSVLEVPISHLSRHDTLKTGPISVRNMIRNDIPYYDLYGNKLWGATAMITSEFMHLCKELQVSY